MELSNRWPSVPQAHHPVDGPADVFLAYLIDCCDFIVLPPLPPHPPTSSRPTLQSSDQRSTLRPLLYPTVFRPRFLILLPSPRPSSRPHRRRSCRAMSTSAPPLRLDRPSVSIAGSRWGSLMSGDQQHRLSPCTPHRETRTTRTLAYNPTWFLSSSYSLFHCWELP
jgi:hypothetical protein